MKQYLKREPLAKALAAARKEFEPVAQHLPPTEKEEFYRTVEKAATIRRIDALVYRHRSLRMWIAPHVLTTSLMLALMLVHIGQVVFFLAK